MISFHLEARAEETVLGPFIPVMSSLPICHSSICLIFIFLFIYFIAGLDCCRVQPLNQEHFLLVYVGGNNVEYIKSFYLNSDLDLRH